MYYKRKEFFMAKIIEGKRRVIKLSKIGRAHV